VLGDPQFLFLSLGRRARGFDAVPRRQTPLEDRVSEVWNWFQQSIAYIVATAGIAALCLVAMRFAA
jgi:hypothetical protein